MATQISNELFAALCRWHVSTDELDELETDELLGYIRSELDKKLQAVIRRELYTKYKTEPTAEARERARQAYLDAAGVPEDFRW